jgi:hypothetical protein
VRAASLFDAAPVRAYRRSASLLFWGGVFGNALWRGLQQGSDAKGHRDDGWTHFATRHFAKGSSAMARPSRSFPGRLTLEQWLMRPLHARINLIWRAQCDLLGSFRYCADRRCRRARTCAGDDPEACRMRLWCRETARPKALRDEWSRLERLKSL